MLAGSRGIRLDLVKKTIFQGSQQMLMQWNKHEFDVLVFHNNFMYNSHQKKKKKKKIRCIQCCNSAKISMTLMTFRPNEPKSLENVLFDMHPTKTQICLCIRAFWTGFVVCIKETLHSWLFKMCPAKILIRLHTGWSESLLGLCGSMFSDEAKIAHSGGNVM